MHGPNRSGGLPPGAGIGLKPQHYAGLLDLFGSGDPDPAKASCSPALPSFLEVHPQNYFGDGGPPHRWLTALASERPLSFHSTGLSLGSADGPCLDDLERLAALCARYGPAMVSDHLSWSGHGADRLPDLLPMPYTAEALDRTAEAVDRVQERLGRRILVENPSRMLAFAADEMDEPAFLAALCRRTGCGLLLDINNIVVSAANLGFDAQAHCDAIDPALVGEIHLAGHAVEMHDDGPLLIDNHGSPVTAATWALYARFLERSGPCPTLIEWDTDVPALEVLLDECALAGRMLAAAGPVRSPVRG